MAYTPPTSAATSTRTGGSGAWANPGAILVSDDSRASYSPITPGLKTAVLQAIGFVSANPPGLTTFRVERQSDPDGTGVSLVVSDLVQLYLSGSPVGSNLSHGEGLPDMDTVEEYPVDLSSIGVTGPDLVAGNLSLYLGWKSSVNDPAAFDPSKWTVVVSPASPKAFQAANSLNVSQAFTITATWNGSLSSCPPYVPIAATGSSTGSGIGSGTPPDRNPTSYTGTATVADGLGGTASGPIADYLGYTGSDPASRTTSTTATKLVTTVSGVGTLVVTPTAVVSVASHTGPSQDATASLGVSGAIGSPPSATVLVDSVMALFPDSGGGGGSSPPSCLSPTVHIPRDTLKDL